MNAHIALVVLLECCCSNNSNVHASCAQNQFPFDTMSVMASVSHKTRHDNVKVEHQGCANSKGREGG